MFYLRTVCFRIIFPISFRNLGEENIREMSLDLFAYRELKSAVPDCEDRYHQIEKNIAGIKEDDLSRYRFKQSKELIGAVEGFMAQMEEWLVNLKGIYFRGMEKTEEEMIRRFTLNFRMFRFWLGWMQS